MPKINRHHIVYKPEFVVEVWARHHLEITYIQRQKATPEFRKYLHNFMISIQHEYNRVCFQLSEMDSKNINPRVLDIFKPEPEAFGPLEREDR